MFFFWSVQRTGTLLQGGEFGRIAHVARAASRPIHVAALVALPVLRAEEAP